MSNTEVITFIFSITAGIFVWTSSVIGMMMWLNAKFNAHERLVFKESARVRNMMLWILKHHSERIMRLELKTFGNATTEGGYEEASGSFDFDDADGNGRGPA